MAPDGTEPHAADAVHLASSDVNCSSARARIPRTESNPMLVLVHARKLSSTFMAYTRDSSSAFTDPNISVDTTAAFQTFTFLHFSLLLSTKQ